MKTKPTGVPFTAINVRACAIREYTADVRPVGRCWFNVVDGKCPRHGDVTAVQKRYAERGELTDETDHHTWKVMPR